jgi:Lipid A 3-O-deacylase (PagL)
LQKTRRSSLLVWRSKHFLLVVLALSGCGAVSRAQTGSRSPYYAPRNSFGVLVAFSPDSSHILLGNAENRILLDFGGSYSRRLLVNHVLNWQYDLELMPVALESDPTATGVNDETLPISQTYVLNYGPVVMCVNQSEPYDIVENGVTYEGTSSINCTGRRWTIGEAMSPVGFRWNFMPRRKTQPFFDGHGGYLYTTQPIPVPSAGSFNFTFDLGAGVELYRSRQRSIRAEFRYHHISNHDTADYNPGIDNLLYQVTYAFGR